MSEECGNAEFIEKVRSGHVRARAPHLAVSIDFNDWERIVRILQAGQGLVSATKDCLKYSAEQRFFPTIDPKMMDALKTYEAIGTGTGMARE